MSRLTAALSCRAGSGVVIIYAPAMDPGSRRVADEADQTVWLVPTPAEQRPSVGIGIKTKAKRSLIYSGITERRQLCKKGYSQTVETEQAEVALPPTAIDPSPIQRVTASVGRSSLKPCAGRVNRRSRHMQPDKT